MRTPEGDQILAIIRQHTGAENSITAPAICATLGWFNTRQRQVRQIISDEAALWPVIVCAKSGDGYFVAVTFDEIALYRNWLADLARSAQAKLESFERLIRQHGLHIPEPIAA